MMPKSNLLSIPLNFFASLLLISLIAAPIYFAQNFAKVAGVKSEASYIISSQVDKFPQMKLEQVGGSFKISFTKQAPSQAYLSVLIITNPTKETKTYTIIQPPTATRAFFGEDVNNLQNEVKVPPQTSVPISLISTSNQNDQNIQFTIQTQ